jgi:heterodisulfide reductase subunit A
MDVRTAGKNYEEFYQRALNEGRNIFAAPGSKIIPGGCAGSKAEDT